MRIATFLGESCQLCLPSVLYVAVKLYLSVFLFDVENLMWIWLFQFPSSLIYIVSELGSVKRKRAFEHVQYAQVRIILLMRKVSSGPLLSIHIFCNI